MGLTYARMRGKVVKLIGEPAVSRMEQVVDVFKTLVTEGPAGLWKWIQEKLGDLKEAVLGPIKEFLVEKVIKAAP